MTYCKSILNILLISFFVIACSDHKEKLSLPGYVEGKYTYISSNINGILKDLYVSRGDIIKVGQPLFSLESVPQDEELEAANARVNEALNKTKKSEENYQLQKLTIERQLILYKKDIITKEELERAMTKYRESYAEYNASKENLNALQADKRKAKWTYQQKTITSPISSLVFDIFNNKGELISNENPVLSLLDPSQIKIIFYIPEFYLAKITINQKVDVFCDSCQYAHKAKIVYISPKSEYTPPVIYSKEEREKLVYRIEATPISKDFLKLHPGQPVFITLPF